MEQEPMNTKQAAEWLGYSVSHLYKLANDNIVPSHKKSGKRFFYASELDAWIKGETKTEEK